MNSRAVNSTSALLSKSQARRALPEASTVQRGSSSAVVPVLHRLVSIQVCPSLRGLSNLRFGTAGIFCVVVGDQKRLALRESTGVLESRSTYINRSTDRCHNVMHCGCTKVHLSGGRGNVAKVTLCNSHRSPRRTRRNKLWGYVALFFSSFPLPFFDHVARAACLQQHICLFGIMSRGL